MPIKNKKKLKILHLASFLGNIGDYANHQGFYKQFAKFFDAKFTQLEIRKFYKNRNEMKFDDSFVELVNKYDLLILGGGGFFDLSWEYSNTGTTIDFSETIMNSIKIPVLVNAMGYHEYEIVDSKNVDKFKIFLESIKKRKNWFLSVRNDGSYERLVKRYGSMAKSIIKVPDSGFLYKPQAFSKLNLREKGITWIGFNITNDLFNKKFNKSLDTETFNFLMGNFLNKLLGENLNYKILLFPHAHQDINTISKILNNVEDKYKREKITVATFITNDSSIDYVFDLYNICSCVVGMRFHTSVCSIGMNIPVIGLAGHAQISGLYNDLKMSDRCIKLDSKHFLNELEVLIKKSIIEKKQLQNRYRKVNSEIMAESNLYIKKIEKWLLEVL